MNSTLIFLIVLVTIAFLIFIFLFMPRKCPKCGKRSVYESHSSFIDKKIEMRTITTKKETKDKKGQLVTEIIRKQEPHEYSEYSVEYVCGACKHSFCVTSRTKGKTYDNYDDFKKSKKLGYIVSSSIFVTIISVLFGCLIGNVVRENSKSKQERMQDFLNEKGRNRTSYSCYDTLGNTRVKGELSYRKGGFQLNDSSYDYLFQITGYPVDHLKATSVKAGVLFSLEPNDTDSFAGLSIVQYSSSSSMACVYLDVSGDDSYNLTYGNSTFLPSEGWETKYNAYEKEWRFYSWHAIKFSFQMLEDVCNSAGFNI